MAIVEAVAKVVRWSAEAVAKVQNEFDRNLEYKV